MSVVRSRRLPRLDDLEGWLLRDAPGRDLAEDLMVAAEKCGAGALSPAVKVPQSSTFRASRLVAKRQ